jgi:hypothetical protein
VGKTKIFLRDSYLGRVGPLCEPSKIGGIHFGGFSLYAILKGVFEDIREVEVVNGA